MEDRIKAMKWWRSLEENSRYQLSKQEFNRPPLNLTGREIQSLWLVSVKAFTPKQ